MQIKRINKVSVATQNTQVEFGRTHSLIFRIMSRSKDEYVHSGIRASLLRNSHMNEYTGEPIDLKRAGRVLNKLVHNVIEDLEPKGSALLKGDIVKWCFNLAENFHASNFSKDFSLSEKTRDAIIVDFLNYVCFRQGLDLGLYTKHLQRLAK